MPNTTRGGRLNRQAEAVAKARRKASEEIQKAEDVLFAQTERHSRRAANQNRALGETYPAVVEGRS
jgi:hypothetical protein